ncbi:MAG: carbohydrate kinase family protein [Lachnospiraceae bacterium]|nr:carbohydrate kinase family protein [Lachnospiraceae bacterium]
MKDGIILAGNMIVDVTYPIERYPGESELTTVMGRARRSIGGLVCNVITDLAKMDSELPLQAIGMVGNDAEGDLMLEELGKMPNINLDQVRQTGDSSITIVMNSMENKKRTFFQYRGNNSYFDESCIDWEKLQGDILHVGYILLLDALDQEDAEYGTKMARLLKHAQDHGLRTSIDVVTETGNRFQKLVPPALKYTNYCVINESEAQQVTGVLLRDDQDRLYPENMPEALKTMKAMGIADWAVIHCPEGGFGLDENYNYVEMPSLKLPADYIKGSVGAGDAFCAGILYGAEKHHCLADAIRLGICAAAASLSDQSATAGLRPVEEVLKLAERYS